MHGFLAVKPPKIRSGVFLKLTSAGSFALQILVMPRSETETAAKGSVSVSATRINFRAIR